MKKDSDTTIKCRGCNNRFVPNKIAQAYCPVCEYVYKTTGKYPDKKPNQKPIKDDNNSIYSSTGYRTTAWEEKEIFNKPLDDYSTGLASRTTVKGDKDISGEFYEKLKGVTFDNRDGTNRQDIISELYLNNQLKPGLELVLKREPDNSEDRYAIAVYGPDNRQIGYIPKKHSEKLSYYIDRGEEVHVYVKDITGGDIGSEYGVNVLIKHSVKRTPVMQLAVPHNDEEDDSIPF